MNENDIFRSIGNVGGDLIESAANAPIKKRPNYKLPVILAACLAVLLALGAVAGPSIASEKKEYDRAVEFFEENALSTEGLTRDEVKSVCRDISSGAFAEPKTAEVLSALSLEKYLTELSSPDRETLRSLWEMHKGEIDGPIDASLTKTRYETALENGKTYVIRYDGQNKIWSYELPDDLLLYALNTHRLDGSVLVYGSIISPSYFFETLSYSPYAILISESGVAEWEYKVASDATFDTVTVDGDELTFFGSCFIYGTYSGRPGGFIVQSVDEFKMVRMSLDGEVLDDKVIKLPQDNLSDISTVDIVDVSQAVKTPDCYLVKTSAATLTRLTHDGEYMGTKSYYDSEHSKYDITDIVCRNGQVFVSLAKKISEEYAEKVNAVNIEYSEKFQELGSSPPFDGDAQKALAETFSASLKVALISCDGMGNMLEVMRQESEMLSADRALSFDKNGNLVWRYMRLSSANPPQPTVSSRCIFGEVSEIKIIFDTAGKPIGKTEMASYTTQISY